MGARSIPERRVVWSCLLPVYLSQTVSFSKSPVMWLWRCYPGTNLCLPHTEASPCWRTSLLLPGMTHHSASSTSRPGGLACHRSGTPPWGQEQSCCSCPCRLHRDRFAWCRDGRDHHQSCRHLVCRGRGHHCRRRCFCCWSAHVQLRLQTTGRTRHEDSCGFRSSGATSTTPGP